jgi:hypothetical protein
MRIGTESEEIDVWIINTSDVRPFRDDSDLILVEARQQALMI